MMGLREKVARAIDPAVWSWEPDASNAVQMEGHAARKRLSLADADAAIAAVLEALKEPTPRMISEGESAASVGIGKPADDEAIPRVWREMLTAFTRGHYLSVLAEEDGKLIE